MYTATVEPSYIDRYAWFGLNKNKSVLPFLLVEMYCGRFSTSEFRINEGCVTFTPPCIIIVKFVCSCIAMVNLIFI